MVYNYPDVDDKNFYANIRNGDWNDGGLEDKYFNECFSQLPKPNRKKVLDAGCGLGKHIPKLTSIFKKVIAIDPDANRLEKTKEKFQNTSPFLEFKNTAIENFNTIDKFDCIVCSQILQHVHLDAADTILNKFYTILKQKGFLILLTTNCLKAEDELLVVNCLTNAHIPVSRNAYNQHVNANDIHLPTHLFTETSLRKLLDKAGFEIIFIKKFNGFPKIKGDNFIFARRL